MDFDVMLPPGQRTVAFAHPAVQQGGAPPPPVAGIPGSKIKQSQMTDQNDESEFLAPTRAEEELYSQNYYQQKSNEPPEEEEPGSAQVKGFDIRVRDGRTPYVDMGTWGPFHRKILKAIKYRTWIPVGDGKYIQKEVGSTGYFSRSGTNFISSAVVSPIYVVVTNPLSRLEVIMQTNSIKGGSISTFEAIGEVAADMRKFGLSGVFRGQGVGIFKAIISLTLFHEGRMFIARKFRESNEAKGLLPPKKK